MKKNSGLKKAAIKAFLLMLFLIAAIVLFQFTSLKAHLNAQSLSTFLQKAGLWAPLAYVIIYAVGVCLFIPGTLLTGLGAAVFGAYKGFGLVWIGAMLGASAAFFIGRKLGRDFAAHLIGDRLKKYDDALKRNGFATVLYLRLIYFPFTALNFGMGLSSVRFKDFFWGTGLGIIAGTFVFTLFIGTLKDVWSSGEWGRLFSYQVLLAIALLIFSFYIPRIIRCIRGEA